MLSADERRRTHDELERNLALTGLGIAEVADRLGLELPRTQAALAVEDADPVDVWLLRDHLEQAVRAAGREPVPFTVLTSAARRRAEGWFGIR